MKAKKIRRRLEKSLTERRIASLMRDAFDETFIDGFVIGLSDDWIILHVLNNGVYLDDLVFLRLQDVSRVRFRDDDPYHYRAIADLGKDVAELDYDGPFTPVDLLREASRRADIFAVYAEVLVDDLFIGTPVDFRKKSLDFHYVGRDGVWAREVDRIKYRDITRIDVGGRYLEALNRYADPYPELGSATDVDL